MKKSPLATPNSFKTETQNPRTIVPKFEFLRKKLKKFNFINPIFLI
jgi:hypothetical protein